MMLGVDWLTAALMPVDEFMQKGGVVIWCLAAIVSICWLLIIERVSYLVLDYPKQREHFIKLWQHRAEQNSWYAKAIRSSWLSQAEADLNKHLPLIKLLVALCPMLGLLGTVTGMITVFDVMAELGSSDPKLMASGIAMATLPTMAGMVAALTGLFAHSRLVKICRAKHNKLSQLLRSAS